MGLCLLLEVIDVFEELRLAFYTGDPFALDESRGRLLNRAGNMNAKEVWDDNFQEAFDLGTAMKVAFTKHGNIKIAEAHVRHPRYDCTTLEEIGCEVTIDTFDSSTTGIGGFLDDLPTA